MAGRLMQHHLPEVAHVDGFAAGWASVEIPALVSEIATNTLSYCRRCWVVALSHNGSSINLR